MIYASPTKGKVFIGSHTHKILTKLRDGGWVKRIDLPFYYGLRGFVQEQKLIEKGLIEKKKENNRVFFRLTEAGGIILENSSIKR